MDVGLDDLPVSGGDLAALDIEGAACLDACQQAEADGDVVRSLPLKVLIRCRGLVTTSVPLIMPITRASMSGGLKFGFGL